MICNLADDVIKRRANSPIENGRRLAGTDQPFEARAAPPPN
jgi:hypothetical protein